MVGLYGVSSFIPKAHFLAIFKSIWFIWLMFLVWYRDFGGSNARARAGLCNTGLKCLVSLMHTDVHVSPLISITKLCLGLIFAYQNLVTLLNQIHYIALTKWMLWPGRAWETLWVPRNHRQRLYMCLSTTQFYFPRRGPVIYIRLSAQLGSKKSWTTKGLENCYSFTQGNVLEFCPPELCYPQISITGLVRMPWSENNRKSD